MQFSLQRLLLAATFMFLVFSGCSSDSPSKTKETSEKQVETSRQQTKAMIEIKAPEDQKVSP